MPLQKLSPSTTRRLSTAQTISSVYDAVKELVENALDSGTNVINVKLFNYGLDKIEVQDNGSGVSLLDVEHMCQPHYTSKINEFSDLENKLETYGFRGEALASLCNIADVEITTRTVNDKFASCFTFDKNGKVLESKPSHYKKGTTVAVLNIFSNMPVRKKFISSSNKCKTEFKKTDMMLKDFAIIHLGVYFSFCHNKCVVWQKSPAQTLKESVKCILGYSIASQLDEISYSDNKRSIVLVVPQRECKGVAALCIANIDSIKIFINQRPVKYNKVQKIVLKCITEFFGANYPQGKYPTCVVDIKVPPCDVDVNIEANKTKVMCHHEDELFDFVEDSLNSYYQSEDQSVVKSPQSQGQQNRQLLSSLQPNQQRHEALKTIVVADQRTLSTCKAVNKVMNPNPVVKCALLSPVNDDFWATVDTAMGLWSRSCLKSGPSDEIENELLADGEDIADDKFSVYQNVAKRACLEGKRNYQAPLAPSNQAINAAVSESGVINEVINSNSWMECVLLRPDELWASADNAMGLWSRGNVKSGSGDIIEGGAVLLRPKDNGTNEESVKKTSQAISAKCKSILENAKKNILYSKKSNSSFHSVSSQMGCKEMSGFTKFCQEIRPKILAETPGMCFTKVATVLSDKWGELSTEGKKRFGKNQESTISNANCKAQNRSLLDMFEKQGQIRMRKVITWSVSVNYWESIPQSKFSRLPENILTSVKLELLHLLPKGIWICKRGEEVGVIHPWCLQEIMIYKNLMESHSVPVIPLDKPFLLKEEDFEPELWQSLTHLKVESTHTNVLQVICPLVTKNGFRLMWENGELYITHVASTIRHYGVEELKEILTLKKSSSYRSHCRPMKVAAFLENQAVRYCNEKQSVIDREKMNKFLELWNNRDDHLCLHQKPIFRLLQTLSRISPPDIL